MIFVTIGSMFPFDRLIRAMDQIAGNRDFVGEMHAQIGSGSYQPQNMTFERFMGKAEFDEKMAQADAVVSHAGVGTIATALSLQKPLLVLPRRKKFKEHVNDHQMGTAHRYAHLGHVLLAEVEDELPNMLIALKSFQPVPRHVNALGVADRINRFLRESR